MKRTSLWEMKERTRGTKRVLSVSWRLVVEVSAEVVKRVEEASDEERD